GTRMARIVQVLRSKTDHDAADFRRMQFDTKGLIPEEVTSRIVEGLRRSGDAALAKAADHLAGWDFVASADSIAPTIFEMFMDRWTPVYAANAGLPADPTVRGAASHAAHRALVGEDGAVSTERLD